MPPHTHPPHTTPEHTCEHRPGPCHLPDPWMCHTFSIDGSLRDITVADTDETHWPEILRHLGDTTDELTWHNGHTAETVDGNTAGDRLAALPDDETGALSIRCGTTTFTAHLPVDGIEFSLWPDDIQDTTHVTDVLRFLTALGTACARPAVLTAETVSGHDTLPPLITYDPTTGTTTHR
ncbi:hypothetical protein [Streptomyces sp. NPDC089795]|uniref:hypothetical protein n=1 Tax=Streptomyces sp. NPDC089795 TaxID=3155297 RepID=UPI00341E7AAD